MTRHARIALALHRKRRGFGAWPIPDDVWPVWYAHDGPSMEDTLERWEAFVATQPGHTRGCAIWDRDIIGRPCNCADAPESEKVHRIAPMWERFGTEHDAGPNVSHPLLPYPTAAPAR